MAEKDYYKILGVNKNASKEEIKAAYKKLAKQFHPDVNKDPGSSEKFKEINEAASVLGDDQKRQQYDTYGSDFEKRYHQNFNREYSSSDFEDMDFGDIFEMFFGGGGSGRTRRSRGHDLRYDLEITLEEAATGIKKSITLEKPSVCEDCDGKGGDDFETCKECTGKGIKKVTQRTPFGIFSSTVTCNKCEGRGELIKDVCSSCKGNGVIRKKKTLEIDIPGGITSGSQLRLRGEGEAIKNGASGDLYVFVEVSEHEYFVRDGDNIIIDLPISFTQAIIGDEVEIPTLTGKVMLKIPSGTQPEEMLRLRGKGIKHLHSSGHGDQLVRIKVKIPEKISKKQEELINEFQKHESKKKSFFDKIFG